MELASTHVIAVEWAPQNACHHCLLPQDESQLHSASPEGSPRSASVSDPASFQTTASALGLRACEILCVPFKSGVSVPYSHLALPNVKPTGFQSQVFWGLVFPIRDLQAGEPDMRIGPLAPGGEPLQLWLSPCLFVADPGVWVLTVLHLCSSYPSHCDSLFVSLIV